MATGKNPEVALARFYLEKGEQIKNSGVSDVVQGLAGGFFNQAILNADQLETDVSTKFNISSKAKALLTKGFEKFRREYLAGFADMFLSYDQLLLAVASGGIGSLLAKSAKLAQLGMKLKKIRDTYRIIKYGSKLVPGFELFASKHGDKIGIGAMKLLGNFAGEVGKIALAEFGAGKVGEAVGGEKGKFYAQKGVALFCFLIPGAKPAFERGMNKKMADVFAEKGATEGEMIFKKWVLKNYKPEQIVKLVREGVTAKIEDAAMASGLPFLRNNPLVKAQIETQVDACINEFGLAKTAVKKSAKSVAEVNVGVLGEKISKNVDALLSVIGAVSPKDFLAFLKGSGSNFGQLLLLIKEIRMPSAKKFLAAKKDLLVKGIDNLVGIIGKALENISYSDEEKGRLFIMLDSLAIVIGRGSLLKKLKRALVEKPVVLELIEKGIEKSGLADRVVGNVLHGGKHEEQRMAGQPENIPYAGDVKIEHMAGDVPPVPMAGDMKPVPVATKDQKTPPVV